jgi:hypothetical protein
MKQFHITKQIDLISDNGHGNSVDMDIVVDNIEEKRRQAIEERNKLDERVTDVIFIYREVSQGSGEGSIYPSRL